MNINKGQGVKTISVNKTPYIQQYAKLWQIKGYAGEQLSPLLEVIGRRSKQKGKRIWA